MNKNILKTVGGLLATGVLTVGSMFAGEMLGDGIRGLQAEHEAKRYAKCHKVLEEAIELCDEDEDSED